MPPAKKTENQKKAYAKRLKDFRAEFLMNQPTLAELLGISRRALQYCEIAKFLPQKKTRDLFETLCRQKQAEKLSKQRQRAKETAV